MIDVRVPKWGLTMTEATVLQWLKNLGEVVSKGEGLLEVETDKVEWAIESPADGILVEIVAQPGDIVEVEGLLGRIDKGA